jgi:hypothetical protein
MSGLMAFAAVVAVATAAWREDSRFTAGMVTVATCVACLTRKLAKDDLAFHKAEGRETNRMTRGKIVSVSAAIAVAVIGTADLAFLAVYWSYMLTVYIVAGVDHFRPYEEPKHIVTGALLGGIAALRLISIATRRIRTPIVRAVTPDSPSPKLEPAVNVEHAGNRLHHE